MKLLKKGFTLIEMLVVILIVGSLAAVALPQYERAVMRSRAADVWSLLPTLRTAAQEYCLANGGGQINIEDLSVSFPSHMKTDYFECSSCTSFLSGYGQVSGILNLSNKDFSQITGPEDFLILILNQKGDRTCQGTPANCKKIGFTKGSVHCYSGYCPPTGDFTE